MSFEKAIYSDGDQHRRRLGGRCAVRRAGMAIAELTVALVLAMVIASLAASTALIALHQARVSGRIQSAMMTADNVLEACLAVPEDQWDEQRLQTLAQQYTASCNVPGAQITIQERSLEGPSPPQPLRLTVQVRWHGHPEGVRMTAFRFPSSAASQP